MNKKLLCATFSLVLICGCLTACDNKEKTNETFEYEENLKESGDEEIEEKVADAAILEETAVEETAVEAVDFEQVILPAYERYVRENFATTDSRPYSFIFLNDDEIPELVVEGDCHAAGNLICTYINDSVVSMRTGRLNFNFLEKQNLLCNSDDYDYYWNAQMVSCEEYNNLLNQIYDTEKAVDKYDFIFYSSIQEAYENIGNTNFSEFLNHIINFELANGVLTVENDSGNKYVSSGLLVIEMEEDVIVRIYTVSS